MLMRTRGLTFQEASQRYDESGEERREAYRKHAAYEEQIQRRRGANYPELRTRNDFTGTPRKSGSC